MMPAVGNLAGGYRDPMDAALAEVRRAIDKARRAGATPGSILGQVANGLTGDLNGYRERILTHDLTEVADPILELTQDEARLVEEARRKAGRSL